MLLEALRHLLLPCPRPLKRLKVLYHLIALESRARRCARAWRPHLEECHAFVAEAVAGSAGRDTVVILGSGLALELPLPLLAESFKSVVLVDLFHMPQVRRVARRFPGVHLVCHDLSGVLEALSPTPLTLPPPHARLPAEAEGADLVLSLNLLSQIPLIPLEAAAKAGLGTEDARHAWAAALVADHLALLASLPGHRALLTDTESQWCDANGRVCLRQPVLFGQPLPPLRDTISWTWDCAPAPEADPTLSLRRHMVSGWLP